MKNPTKWLSHLVTAIENAGNVMHDEITCIFLILDCIVLDINLSPDRSTNNLDSTLRVFVDRSGTLLLKTKCLEDSMEVLNMFSSRNGS